MRRFIASLNLTFVLYDLSIWQLPDFYLFTNCTYLRRFSKLNEWCFLVWCDNIIQTCDNLNIAAGIRFVNTAISRMFQLNVWWKINWWPASRLGRSGTCCCIMSGCYYHVTKTNQRKDHSLTQSLASGWASAGTSLHYNRNDLWQKLIFLVLVGSNSDCQHVQKAQGWTHEQPPAVHMYKGGYPLLVLYII